MGEDSGVVKRVDEVAARPVPAGRATEMQVLLGPADGSTGFVVRRFVMGEGGGMPRHANAVEHGQYVLRGRARVSIGDRVHEVGPGSVLFIPSGAVHHYEVVEAPFEFLCVVPNRPDEVVLES
ncbi:MAG: cupin domain-containing protein [Acidobacteria bacterium]|nr:MAG: cupin domain-containing protein [Acidobacteriota bacterium]